MFLLLDSLKVSLTTLSLSQKGIHFSYLLLYVDDIILIASSDDLQKYIKSLLKFEFAMKDLGLLNKFLAIDVTRHPGGLFLSQKKYTEEIIERPGMSSCKPCPTPVDTKPKMSAKSSTPFDDPSLYRSLVGAIQYLTFTRSDIYYAVKQICLVMHNPIDDHINALRRILKYIQGTREYGPQLYSSSTSSFIAYAYSYWGGCLDTRRSTSGCCAFLGENLLSWSS